jgi:uncharacterized protein (UPF0335 family)
MTDRELLERLVEEVAEIKARLGSVENDVTDIKADVKVVKADVATIKSILTVDQEAQNLATVRRAAAGRRDVAGPLAAKER